MHEKFLSNVQSASFDPLDFEGSFKRKVLDPEQALMLAVLRSVVDDFLEYVDGKGGIEKKLFREAEEWIREQDTHWVFSFENICEALQLQPEYIRRGLLSWKEENRAVTLPTRADATVARPILRSLRQRHYARSRPRRAHVIDLMQALKQNMEQARAKKKAVSTGRKKKTGSYTRPRLPNL